nr:unnamed protein product [Callosobruchus analis]
MIELITNFTGKNVVVTAVYRSPSTCPKTFINDLCNYLDQTKNNTQVLVGGMNIDISNNSEISNYYLDVLGSLGFEPYINGYTRVQQETKSCIDHMFVKDLNLSFQYTPIIMQYDISDHYPIIIQVLASEKETHNNSLKFIQYLDKKKLISNTSLEEWTQIYTSNTLELATNIFVDKLQNINPNKVKLKRNEIKRSPWVTNKFLRMIEVKSNMYKIIKRKPTAENNQNYKQIKNKVPSRPLKHNITKKK